MEIRTLKENIENNTLSDSSLIFVGDNSFIPNQYIARIALNINKQITYVNDLDQFKHLNPFFEYKDIYVYSTNVLDRLEVDLSRISHLYIICKKCSLDLECVVKIPKLEEWQIKDYIMSKLPNFSTENADELFLLCGKDIFRIDTEINRLSLFADANKRFAENKINGTYLDLSKDNIFDFINAIENKNLQKIFEILYKINFIDIEPLGVVTLLYNAFRKMLILVTTKYPDENNTGIKSNQIWILKKIASLYTPSQLLHIFRMLCSLQKQLVEGYLPEAILIDYMLINLFAIEEIS